jgi:hypothetical protein
MQIKAIISLVAILLIFIGYAPYIRDILNGKTRPHIFSWFIWGITTGIAYALQVSAGAGVGSWVTLCITLVLISVFFLGLKNGNRDIRKIDIVFLVLSLLAIPIWLIVKQPVISIILLATIEMLGFVPTIRKSWDDPYSETLSLYTITTFRHGLAIFALEKLNFITVLYPIIWVIANALFAIILIIRRKKLAKNPLD